MAMFRKFFLSLIFLALWAGSADAQGDLLARSKALFQPIPDKPPALKDNNPLTPEKIDLGKMLYFDPRLSASSLISCNTCHNLGLGGADLQETSVGHGWQKGPRNAPTTLNAVFNIAQFWDGRAKDLAEQAKGPVQASVEMNNKPADVVKTLKSIPEYAEKFSAAFPGVKEPLTFDNMAMALEAFEATLLTPDSAFDRYLKGEDSALSSQEKRGLLVFMDKGCGSCHNGVNIGGTGYFPFGVKEAPPAEVRPPGDKGRFKVTSTAADQYVFRAPALRNVAITMPYFHSGKVWKLEDAVAIMGSAQLGIRLTEEESGDITAFLGTLTGKQPQVEYPILPPSSDTTPHPVLK
jgi:cytochrome c peroxidase